MNFKRIPVILLCGVCCMGLAACDNKSSSSSASEGVSQSDETSAQSAASTENLMQRDVVPENKYDSPTLVVDSISAKAGEQKVPVRVFVFNNKGYNLCGLRFLYDKQLKPQYNAEDATAEFTAGVACAGMMAAAFADPDEGMIGFASMGVNDLAKDGELFTVYLDVPQNAKSGTEYLINLEVEDFTNTAGDQISQEIVAGKIVVE